MKMGTWKDYGVLVAHKWYVVFIGLIAGVIGTVKDIGFDVPLPAWVWWVLALASLSWAQFEAFRQVRSERNALRHPEPDMSLSKVVRRILGTEDVWEADKIGPAGKALDAIRQKAVLGSVTIWGRRDCAEGHEANVPLVPIPKETWDVYQIDFMEFMKNEKGATDSARIGLPTMKYHDLFLNGGQVALVWPEKRKPIRLQWPIKRAEGGSQ